MTSEIKDLHFKHTFSSGEVIRLSVQRAANTRPKVVADSVAHLGTDDLREYLKWREGVVATMMATLTPGEVLECAAYGMEKLERKTRRA